MPPPCRSLAIRLVAITCAALLNLVLLEGQPVHCDATTSDAELHKHRITKIVDPVYPARAIESKVMGLVVADVCVALGKQVAIVDVPVAPDESIRKSVMAAVRQWRFKSPETLFGSTRAHSYGGKVVFYFVYRAGRWTVFSSVDSFYVGPQFARPLGEQTHSGSVYHGR